MKKLTLTIASLSLLSLGFGQSVPTPCTGVVADFTSEIYAAAGGIKFTNITSNSGTNSLNYSWDFGNDTFSSENNPFSMFDEGTFTVKLTVSDDSGCETVVEKDVLFSYD